MSAWGFKGESERGGGVKRIYSKATIVKKEERKEEKVKREREIKERRKRTGKKEEMKENGRMKIWKGKKEGKEKE